MATLNVSGGKTTFAGPLSLNGAVTIAAGSTLQLSNSGTVALANAVSGAGTMDVSNGTTLVIANEKPISAALLVNGGVVDVIANNNKVIAGDVSIHNGGKMMFSYTGSAAYDCIANSGNHTITLNNGTLDFGSTRQTLSSWSITMSNGSLISGVGEKYSSYQAAIDVDAASMTISATAGQNEISAWTRLRNDNTKMVYNVSEGASLKVSGLIQSDGETCGGIEKQGAGDLIFTRDHSYTNATAIAAGKLILDLGTVTTGVGENAVTTNGVYTLKGAVTGAGTLQVNGGTTLKNNANTISTTLVLNGGDATLKGGGKIEGNITVNNGSTLTFDTATSSDTLKMGGSQKLTVNKGGVVDFQTTRQTMGDWTIELNGGEVTGVGQTLNGTYYGAIDYHKKMAYVNALSGDSTISAVTRLRGEVDVNGKRIGRGDITYYVKDAATLNVSGKVHTDNRHEGGIVKTGAGVLHLNNQDDDLDKILVQKGTANIHGAEAYNLTELQAAASVNIGFYAGATKDTSTKRSVTVSGTALLGGGASLTATILSLDEGATLDMVDMSAGAVTLNGALTFGGQLVAGDNLLAILNEMSSWENHELTLITGLDSFTFDGVEVEDGSMLQASTYFSNVSDTVSVSYRVSGDVGSLVLVSMDVVPEPTTSTLSLLALAGLCARRRRKD